MQRGERIYIADAMSDIVYEGKLCPEDIYTDDEPEISEEQLIEAMEELLQENIEYFTFDW